ncbi:hypothetical protein [Zobellella denitrificans]|uniref:hypothetical protein n=1 Tax=Zobellella denitrificans TaxID=347534 RepID=UPI0012FE6CF9|nr:hypothetical protein [Zobellella denitrificans]
MNQDIAHKLYVRFGLTSRPSPEAVARWAQITEQLIAEGCGVHEAGERAARQVFPDCHSMMYFSQADTIEALLAALRNRPR